MRTGIFSDENKKQPKHLFPARFRAPNSNSSPVFAWSCCVHILRSLQGNGSLGPHVVAADALLQSRLVCQNRIYKDKNGNSL